MRSSKLEWFQFYPRDWLSDPKLARASIATRGIWLELISSMFIEELHFVTGDRFDLARLARCDEDDIDSFIAEAQRYGFADVTECNGTFTVACRRLAREQKERGRIREAVRTHRSNRASAPAGNENVNQDSTPAPEPCNGDVTSVSVSKSVSLSSSFSGGKSARRGVAVTWPEGFALDDGMRAYAVERGIDPEPEFEAFRDWAISKGARYVDWRAAWRTRINNAPRFGVMRAPARAAPSGPNFGNGGMANLAKHLGMNGNDARRNGEATRVNQGQLVQAADRRPDDPHVAGNPRSPDGA